MSTFNINQVSPKFKVGDTVACMPLRGSVLKTACLISSHPCPYIGHTIWFVMFQDGTADEFYETNLTLVASAQSVSNPVPPQNTSVATQPQPMSNMVSVVTRWTVLPNGTVDEQFITKSCECGAESVKSNIHSGWCPKYS